MEEEVTRMARNPYKQRCTGKSKQSQKRCKNWAIAGGTVCVMHGGKNPRVMEKARERLQELVHPALDRLERVVTKSEHDPAAVNAAKLILDRAGMKPTDRVEISTDADVRDPGRERLSDELLEQLIRWGEQGINIEQVLALAEKGENVH